MITDASDVSGGSDNYDLRLDYGSATAGGHARAGPAASAFFTLCSHYRLIYLYVFAQLADWLPACLHGLLAVGHMHPSYIGTGS